MTSRTWRLSAPLLLLLLTACTLPGPPDDLGAKLERYYAEHAAEEAGTCQAPRIDSITKRKVLQSTAERTVLRVRYSYVDNSRNMDVQWDRVFHAERPCNGFAERDFTLERTKLGYQVIDMSGARRQSHSELPPRRPRQVL